MHHPDCPCRTPRTLSAVIKSPELLEACLASVDVYTSSFVEAIHLTPVDCSRWLHTYPEKTKGDHHHALQPLQCKGVRRRRGQAAGRWNLELQCVTFLQPMGCWAAGWQ